MESSLPNPPQAPVRPVQFAVAKKRTSLMVRVFALFLVPLVGAIAGLSLIRVNQDLRQQAETVYDSPSTTPTPAVTSTPAPTPSPTPIPTPDFNLLAYKCSESGGTWTNSSCVRPTITTIPTPDSCTSQEYLSCANGCDPNTGKCKASSPTPVPTITAQTSGLCETLSCPAGQVPTPLATAGKCSCKDEKKPVGQACSGPSDCQTGNCLALPSGKFCAEGGVTLVRTEGQSCGTTLYDRACQAGLVCSGNTCVKLQPTPTEPEIIPLVADSLAECMGKGVWIQNACWPQGTSTFDILARTNRTNDEACSNDSQCQSGSCNWVGVQTICTINVETTGGAPKYASGESCREGCTSQGGSEKVCNSICSQYNTSDENLLAIGQTINTLTFGTFADYVATNIELTNGGLEGWARYTDPRALEANTNFGLVLTAEGALAYTGIGALAGTGSAATFGATANLVNTGYSAYQAQQACTGAETAQQKQNCTTALIYAGFATASLGTSAYSLAAQNADDLARAAQLANNARLWNAGVSALEIETNLLQTYQACQGSNANVAGCLVQGGLSILHGLGSYNDLAYANNVLDLGGFEGIELLNYNHALQQNLEAQGISFTKYTSQNADELYGGTYSGPGEVAGFFQPREMGVYVRTDFGYLTEQRIALHEMGHAIRELDGSADNLYHFFGEVEGNTEALKLMRSGLEEVGNMSDNTLPLLRSFGLDDVEAAEREYFEYNVQRYLAGLNMLDEPDNYGELLSLKQNTFETEGNILIPGEQEVLEAQLLYELGKKQILIPNSFPSLESIWTLEDLNWSLRSEILLPNQYSPPLYPESILLP